MDLLEVGDLHRRHPTPALAIAAGRSWMGERRLGQAASRESYVVERG